MRRSLTVAVLPLLAFLPAACMVQEQQKAPLEGAKPPAEPNPSRMVITMRSYPQDKDANGYADTLPVSIHLFEPEGGWPLAVTAPGTFRFTARRPGSTEAIATWDFDPAKNAGMIIRGQVGPTYVFELSLLTDGRSDRIDVETLDIHVLFKPTDSNRQPIKGVISTHFGRTR